MKSTQRPIEFLPTSQRKPPSTRFFAHEDGDNVYTWYITEDEYLRLNKLFGREFQEADLGATRVVGKPSPCTGCGKYTEFIDWVWTALHRGVHSTDFMFMALKNSRQGIEPAHDVYCSECGTLTAARSIDNAEGGAQNIFLAGRLKRSDFSDTPPRTVGAGKQLSTLTNVITWGKWWLDDNGKYRGPRKKVAVIEPTRRDVHRLAAVDESCVV